MSALLSLGIALVMLPAVFWPLERLFPARAQRLFRGEFSTDLAFMAGQYLVWPLLALHVLTYLDAMFALVVPGALRGAVAACPWALQALVAVAAGDVCVYWFHVASHRVPWLWRFHSVHHSSRHLDWLAAHREHPVDGLLTQLAINGPAMLLGVDMTLLGWLVGLRGVWAIFIHSNVRLPLGPLRVLLGAPELHHWHHLETRETKHNFANLAPWTDLLFGTYHRPPTGEETWPLGNPGEAPRSYLAHLVLPLLPERAQRGAPPSQVEVMAATRPDS